MILTSGYVNVWPLHSDDYSPTRHTDVFALVNGTLFLCSHSFHLPFVLYRTTGGYLRSSTAAAGNHTVIPVVCGGKTEDYSAQKCYRLGSDKVIGKLAAPRDGGLASTVVNNGRTLWVTGGDSGNSATTTELLDLSIDSNHSFSLTTREGLQLPIQTSHYCLQTVDNETVILYGGYHDYSSLNDTWTIRDLDSGVWERQAPMTTPRSRLICGVLDVNGQKVIVAAGGVFDGDTFATTDTTELLAALNEAWQPGPDLPTKLASAGSATTPDQSTMFIAGGIISFIPDSFSRSIYSLQCANDILDCQWTMLDFELAYPRTHSSLAMILPPYSIDEGSEMLC